jgi:hypothetical protein
MNNYAFVEGKKIKSAKFYWDLRFSLKKGTEPEKIKKTPLSPKNKIPKFLIEQISLSS